MEKTYAIIEDGAVANMALADAPLDDNWIHAPAGVAIGWLYEGEVFSAPPAPEPLPEAVLDSCTRRQGLLALLSFGIKRADIEVQIAAIENETEREAALIEYEAATWERDNPFLQGMWAALGGTPSQLDDLFRLAVTL